MLESNIQGMKIILRIFYLYFKSVKILFVHLKWEIIIVLSNCFFLSICYSNILPFSIASTAQLSFFFFFASYFGISSLDLFFTDLSLVITLSTFSILEAILFFFSPLIVRKGNNYCC